jgi:endonuclease/exonuclease/phosphatase family metal-dependent hydrolase
MKSLSTSTTTTRMNRPYSILPLLVQLIRSYRRAAALAFGLMLLMVVVGLRACPNDQLRVATFNIRNFPENAGQIEGAFETIADLDVPLVAVQEITDPPTFALAAQRLLGNHWHAEFGPYSSSERIVQGVLYDATTFEVDYARLHHETKLGKLDRPTLEVRLVSTGGGSAVRVFVVHLKAGGDSADVRARQVAALTPVIQDATRSRDDIVVLGDFNSTGNIDRVNLRRFAHDTNLHWATLEIACTSYWKPGDECLGSALDHVFTSHPSRDAVARGPCEDVGCDPGESCPVFYDQISDHCPVTTTF